MAEINHRVGIACSVQAVYAALTTDAGLSGWWTHDTRGAGRPFPDDIHIDHTE